MPTLLARLRSLVNFCRLAQKIITTLHIISMLARFNSRKAVRLTSKAGHHGAGTWIRTAHRSPARATRHVCDGLPTACMMLNRSSSGMATALSGATTTPSIPRLDESVLFHRPVVTTHRQDLSLELRM